MSTHAEIMGLSVNLKFNHPQEYDARIETMRQEWKSKMKRACEFGDEIFTQYTPFKMEKEAKLLGIEDIPSIQEMFYRTVIDMHNEKNEDPNPF